jgi:hypothetical protein
MRTCGECRWWRRDGIQFHGWCKPPLPSMATAEVYQNRLADNCSCFTTREETDHETE